MLASSELQRLSEQFGLKICSALTVSSSVIQQCFIDGPSDPESREDISGF